MNYRKATLDDCSLLGELNRQLIEDEGHRNPMSAAELADRMGEWLASDYEAILFEDSKGLVGYALYRFDPGEIYLRQLFVARNRRRQGFGRQAIRLLREQLWPRDRRILVEVLWQNEGAMQFWRAAGFSDYSLALELLPDQAKEG